MVGFQALDKSPPLAPFAPVDGIGIFIFISTSATGAGLINTTKCPASDFAANMATKPLHVILP
jgi:hypothetical protein